MTILTEEVKFLQEELKTAFGEKEKMKAALNECLTYLERHYDVIDGGNGEPAPNEAMRLGQMIEDIIGVRF